MTGRDDYLNPAYAPKWKPVNEPQSASLAAMNPMGDTRFDPFAGTPWGHFFDSLRGARMADPALAPSQTLDESGTDMRQSPGAVTPDYGALGGVPPPAARLKKAVKGLQ